MKHLLTFDIGNSHPNFIWWSESNKIVRLANKQNLDWLTNMLVLEDINEIFLYFCSVRSKLPNEIDYFIQTHHKIIKNKNPINLATYFSQNQYLGMPVHYSETLGMDRLIQSYFLYKNNLDKAQILIDAGTFFTIDLITSKGFQGGFIAPNLENYLNLYQLGDQLPKIFDELSLAISENSLPQNTHSAISSTYYHLLTKLVEQLLKIDKSVKTIYLTGGKLDLCQKLLTLHPEIKTFSIITKPILIHESMNYIFQQIES